MNKINQFTVYFILCTVPLVFGARHALVHGTYNCFILLACGMWLIFNYRELQKNILTFNRLAPLVILVFWLLTAIPLPFSLLEIISPVRANYLSRGIELGGLENVVASLSYYTPVTMYYVVYGSALFLLYMAAQSLFQSKDRTMMAIWIITFIGLFESIYGLLQVTNPDIGVLWLPGDMAYQGYARGTIIYKNQYAAFLNMCWPLSLVLGIILFKPHLEKQRVLRQQKRSTSLAQKMSLLFQKAALPLWCSAFMILAVFFSGSRGGMLTMVIIAGIFIAFLPISFRMKTACSVCLAAFLILYGGAIGLDKVTDRFASFYESAIFRMNLWVSSLDMLRDHLFAGIGMGTYEFLSPVYLRNVPEQVWFDRAHNEYIELAVELGVPVMILLVMWLVKGMIGQALKLRYLDIRNKTLLKIRSDEVVALGAFCGLLGLLLHAVVDFVWRLPANMMYAVVLLGMLNGTIANSEVKIKNSELRTSPHRTRRQKTISHNPRQSRANSTLQTDNCKLQTPAKGGLPKHLKK